MELSSCQGLQEVFVHMKLFNLCNHLVKHYCFHMSLTQQQRFREVRKGTQGHWAIKGRAVIRRR